MKFFKRQKSLLFIILAMALVLLISFFAPETPQKGGTEVKESSLAVEEKEAEPIKELPDIKEDVIIKETEKENKLSEVPVLKEETSKEEVTFEQESAALSCTLSVKCLTALKNIDKIKEGKRVVVPDDGIIYPESTHTFTDGESAFDLLKRVTKEHGIHLEFEITPAYNSAYIRGIGNLYEFDGGDLSGWLYLVNGKIPSFGCSDYLIKNNDKIEFLYTLDMGADLF